MSDENAAEAAQKIDDLMFICERLSSLLERESAALERNRPDEIDALLEEKGLMCRAYEQRGKALMENQQMLDSVDQETRERLLELTRGVEAKIAENTRQLAIQIEVNRMFFDALASAARDNAPKSGVYSNSGTLDQHSKAAPQGLPLSIDQSL